ncbi:SGNH/GDSL hydrolase family protein [Dactylosporangium sp. CA-092794]|uniref:SGNH/GDSL hydrolase family protein n=1 Tax=Dactylosporangium sp. CA-092794 TaxID=3239929 RepID=UPI003D89E228
MSVTWRGSAALAALTAAVITAAQLGTAIPAAAAPGPPPGSIASMGDSISRGFNACGWYVDCPSRSFSTGTDTGVNSHYLRIRAVNPAISGHNFNDAESGATVADMPGQAAAAVSQGAGYVTILIGANDACTSSESTMTGVAAFRSTLDGALATLKSGLPNAKILLISIPDIKRLWQVGSTNAAARTVWSLFGICQSMLANPTSTSAADSARRDRVRQRVIDFNGQLAAACIAYGANCKYDGGAVFGYQFSLSEVSTWDYFHPNASGQAVLASISYAAGFAW